MWKLRALSIPDPGSNYHRNQNGQKGGGSRQKLTSCRISPPGAASPRKTFARPARQGDTLISSGRACLVGQTHSYHQTRRLHIGVSTAFLIRADRRLPFTDFHHSKDRRTNEFGLTEAIDLYLMRPQSGLPMSYLVTVSVEIKNGTSGNYENVCAAFETLGLKRPASEHSRQENRPTALLAGTFTGESGAEIRDALGKACVEVFKENSLKGEIFLAVARMDASDQRAQYGKNHRAAG